MLRKCLFLVTTAHLLFSNQINPLGRKEILVSLYVKVNVKNEHTQQSHTLNGCLNFLISKGYKETWLKTFFPPFICSWRVGLLQCNELFWVSCNFINLVPGANSGCTWIYVYFIKMTTKILEKLLSLYTSL